jgi:hypothetical protein
MRGDDAPSSRRCSSDPQVRAAFSSRAVEPRRAAIPLRAGGHAQTAGDVCRGGRPFSREGLSSVIDGSKEGRDQIALFLFFEIWGLVLSRVIGSIEDDPAQLRNAVYELARIKLRKEAWRRNPAINFLEARRLTLRFLGARRSKSREGTPSRRPQAATWR